MKISCAITAGGKATRFNGITKALIEIEGERIIDKNLKILRKKFKEIIIISNDESVFFDYSNISIFKDFYCDIGPIGGLHSAIKNANEDAVFLISSDLPYISEEIITLLIDNFSELNCDILVPKIGNKIEPLFGIYSMSILKNLENFIEKRESYAMRDFFARVNTQYLELNNDENNNQSFININEPKDLFKAK